MGPFSPIALSTTRLLAGVASANLLLRGLGQLILTAPVTNTAIIYIEFGPTNVTAAIIPVAAGPILGGIPLLPGAVIEITVPSGQRGLIGNYLAYIAGAAAQDLLVTEGGDV